MLKFKGGYPAGLFGRIARNSFSENHAFGICSTGPSSGEHRMYCVGQGDLSRGLIKNPPTHLWTRAFKYTGLPSMTSFYRRGLYGKGKM